MLSQSFNISVVLGIPKTKLSLGERGLLGVIISIKWGLAVELQSGAVSDISTCLLVLACLGEGLSLVIAC